MTQLKIQKIVFYVQAFHLAMYNKPLFDDDFEAWVHGPVSRRLYAQLIDFGGMYDDIKYERGGSENPIEEMHSLLTSGQIELINEVLANYTPLSGPELERLTHSEAPWINARRGVPIGDPCQNKIDRKEMANFYRPYLYEEA